MKIEIGVCPNCGGTTRVVKTMDVCTACDWYEDRDLAAFRVAWDACVDAILAPFERLLRFVHR